jgi:hypothetical protein
MEEKIIVRLEADIADLKTQLGAAETELKRFGLGVETSLNTITLDRLNLELKQLQTQLGATDIGSQAFKNIGTQITLVENKINSALTSISANANRSRTGFNGLNNSINQISRELPAFGLSANIGFLAISNNLPILVDEINKVRLANKALAADSQATTSVFKQLVGALFSWQTALSLGVTLLTIYGGKIVELISNFFKGKEVITSAKLELDALNETYKDKSIQGAISDIVLLRSSLDTASKSVAGKKQFVEQYNKTIGTVTGTVNTFAAAEKGLINGTGAYVKAMIARATATKVADKAGEISLKIEDKKVEHAKQNAEDQIDLQKQFSAQYKQLLHTANLKGQQLSISETDFVKKMIAVKKAAIHKGQQEELAALQKQYNELEKITEKYYQKSGQITPFVPEPKAKAKKPKKTLAEIIKFVEPDMQSIMDTDYNESSLLPKKISSSYIDELAVMNVASEKLFQITDEHYGKYQTIFIPTEEQKAAALAHTNEVITAQTMLLGALTAGFEQMFTTILDGGQNAFQGILNALKQLMIKLAAAIAAAAVLFVLTGGLTAGGSKLGSIGQIASKYGGLGFNPFELFGGGKTKSVYMPSNSTGQGGYQVDIMGDKMRLLLDNQAIKNSRVV